MTRDRCKNLCREKFTKIVRLSIAGFRKGTMNLWRKCVSCDVYWRYCSIQSDICPCCHRFLSRIKYSNQYDTNTKRKQRQEANKRHYALHKESILQRGKKYYADNKDKWKNDYNKRRYELDNVSPI